MSPFVNTIKSKEARFRTSLDLLSIYAVVGIVTVKELLIA